MGKGRLFILINMGKKMIDLEKLYHAKIIPPNYRMTNAADIDEVQLFLSLLSLLYNHRKPLDVLIIANLNNCMINFYRENTINFVLKITTLYLEKVMKPLNINHLNYTHQYVILTSYHEEEVDKVIKSIDSMASYASFATIWTHEDVAKYLIHLHKTKNERKRFILGVLIFGMLQDIGNHIQEYLNESKERKQVIQFEVGLNAQLDL
jgi:hypothetical protein